MNKMLLTLIFLGLCATSFAQGQPGGSIPHGKNKTAVKDTAAHKDSTYAEKEPSYYYLSLNTIVFVNTKGGFGKRFSPALEFGHTFGIFDIGLAYGKTNTLGSGSDTTSYLEFRPTINIFSKGRFSEALCLGGGYVFNAQQGLMTEICNSININLSSRWALAVVQGYIYYDGTNSSRGAQYMGFNVTYNFLKSGSKDIKRKKAIIISDN